MKRGASPHQFEEIYIEREFRDSPTNTSNFIMSPSADHEGYRIGRVDASTTVVVVGAGPSGLMLAYVTPSFSILDTKVFADVILFVSESRW